MPPSPKFQTIRSNADALEVHLSNLHARLAATLDALDDMTRRHEAELAGLHDQAHYLRAKCQAFKSRAKEAETERDELKADVNKLVEKVEVANDHRVLPHSRIHLPRPLGVSYPHEEFVPSQPSIRLEEDVHRDVYFPAILNSLNAELSAEKYAFSELQRVSEARIAALEAQVARRDAQLYAFKQCSCRSSSTSEPPASNTHQGNSQPAGTTLSNAQYTLIEKETAMRQRTLEVEIEGLRRKLQSAQTEAFRPKSPPVSEGLRGTSLKFRTPTSLDQLYPVPDPTIHPVVSDIDRQLARIGKEVGILQAERDNVKTEVEREREDDSRLPDNIRDENFRGVLLIEEECIRLRESERSLRQELSLAVAAASSTEQSLKSLVNRLQRQIHMLGHPGISDISAHEQVDMDPDDGLLNDVASEHNITTSAKAPSRSSTPPAPSSPGTISQGMSNDRHDSYQSPSPDRPPSAPPFFPSNHPAQAQRHSDTRLERIESELNQARSDVREKDQAINTLRAQLATLQKAAQSRKLRERGGP